MTPPERDQLTHFLNQLSAAKLPEKNPEADAMIRAATAIQPDAAYLLVQRNMLLEQALNGAKAQIETLQGQLQASRGASRANFLGNNPWAQPQEPAQIAGPVPGAGYYQMPRAVTAANAGGGAPSFLGNMASTAAGVVAGSFLFQGIESLLGHHSPGDPSAMQHASEFPTEQTVINNYYGTDADQSWTSPGDDHSFLAGDDADFIQDDNDDSTWV